VQVIENINLYIDTRTVLKF